MFFKSSQILKISNIYKHISKKFKEQKNLQDLLKKKKN